jgi:hypothetical protein
MIPLNYPIRCAENALLGAVTRIFRGGGIMCNIKGRLKISRIFIILTLVFRSNEAMGAGVIKTVNCKGVSSDRAARGLIRSGDMDIPCSQLPHQPIN